MPINRFMWASGVIVSLAGLAGCGLQARTAVSPPAASAALTSVSSPRTASPGTLVRTSTTRSSSTPVTPSPSPSSSSAPVPTTSSAPLKHLSQVLLHRQPQRLVMVTSQRGYLLTSDHALWVTTSGGRQWQRVPAFPTVLTLTTTDHHVWIATPRHLWIWEPGPARWAVRALPSFTQSGAAYDGVGVHFINARDGWLVTNQGGANGAFPVTLWVTLSGGHHWRRVATHGLPYQGTKVFTFVTPQQGWMVGYDSLRFGVVQFFQTHSGGTHWAPVSLTLPSAFRDRIVMFSGFHPSNTTDGLMVVSQPLPNARAATVHWTIFHGTASVGWEHGAIHAAAPASQPPSVTWTGSTAWIVNGPDLWEGRDWGRHWQLVYHGKAPLGALTWTMTQSPVGFAIMGDQMVHSTQNGSTWTPVP